MHNKMLFAVLCICLFSMCFATVIGQGVTMGSPVVRMVESNVLINVRVESFNAGDKYRIGLGVAGEAAIPAEMTFTKGGGPVGEVSEFTQGFTAHWWHVDQLMCRGFELTGDMVPMEGEEGTLQMSIPKTCLEGRENIYIFVSKDYGSDTWYLEDGSELDKSFW
jgi:hypothetical protein